MSTKLIARPNTTETDHRARQAIEHSLTAEGEWVTIAANHLEMQTLFAECDSFSLYGSAIEFQGRLDGIYPWQVRALDHQPQPPVQERFSLGDAAMHDLFCTVYDLFRAALSDETTPGRSCN
jgi:hypothetical protein